ncbi:MAG: hypothetical protein MI717_15320 [Spirochaetales bacterium]|nr:hypothetical protein [Spirochaetales bacterium]
MSISHSKKKSQDMVEFLPTSLSWDFPLPRPFCGIPMGNGTLGVLIWGDSDRIHITMGMANLWDHRGGMEMKASQNYQSIKEILKAHDEEAMETLFRSGTGQPGEPRQPTILPFGRWEIKLKTGWRVLSGRIMPKKGCVFLDLTNEEIFDSLELGVNPNVNTLWIHNIQRVSDCLPHPSWETLSSRFAPLGFTPPKTHSNGWVWELPEDDGVGSDIHWEEDWMEIQAFRFSPKTDSDALKKFVLRGEIEAHIHETESWWTQYYEQVPTVALPHPTLQHIHDLGLWMLGAASNPTGTPMTLQGPWFSDLEMPPWSGDYHFNINVQMCYGPAWRSGLAEHVRPMLEMVWSWRERLRENARCVVGIDDGFLLPHAVDDTGKCMGAFWTGNLDHACTAWTAMMMAEYWRYSGDIHFLKNVGYPFMCGAMNVYFAMLEDHDEGGWQLPVSVSPEYRGSGMDAWGINSSFQLAAIHRLAADCCEAAEALDVKEDDRWRTVMTALPPYSVACYPYDPESRLMIALWENLVPEMSHRHHSHLACLVPFATIDPQAPEHQDIVKASIELWTHHGMGEWSGWCVPWASSLRSRLKQGEMAEYLLETWRRVYCNSSGMSLHDPVLEGFSRISSECSSSVQGLGDPTERFQLDGAMGALSAVQDMLVDCYGGVLRFFPGVPSKWNHYGFDDFALPGGLRVSAQGDDNGLFSATLIASSSGKITIELLAEELKEDSFTVYGGLPLMIQKSHRFQIQSSIQGELHPEEGVLQLCYCAGEEILISRC